METEKPTEIYERFSALRDRVREDAQTQGYTATEMAALGIPLPLIGAYIDSLGSLQRYGQRFAFARANVLGFLDKLLNGRELDSWVNKHPEEARVFKINPLKHFTKQTETYIPFEKIASALEYIPERFIQRTLPILDLPRKHDDLGRPLYSSKTIPQIVKLWKGKEGKEYLVLVRAEETGEKNKKVGSKKRKSKK